MDERQPLDDRRVVAPPAIGPARLRQHIDAFVVPNCGSAHPRPPRDLADRQLFHAQIPRLTSSRLEHVDSIVDLQPSAGKVEVAYGNANVALVDGGQRPADLSAALAI